MIKKFENYSFASDHGGEISMGSMTFYNKGVYYSPNDHGYEKELCETICEYPLTSYDEKFNEILSTSNVFYFWTTFTYKGKVTKQNSKTKVKKFPKPQISKEVVDYLKEVYSYIEYLKQNKDKKIVFNNYHTIQNNIVGMILNDVINFILVECYFPQGFNSKDLHFIRDRVKIGDRDIEENISDLYFELREPDCKFRNYQLLSGVRCPKLIPIISLHKY